MPDGTPQTPSPVISLRRAHELLERSDVRASLRYAIGEYIGELTALQNALNDYDVAAAPAAYRAAAVALQRHHAGLLIGCGPAPLPRYPSGDLGGVTPELWDDFAIEVVADTDCFTDAEMGG